MRVKFEIDVDNNVTILDEDQDNSYVRVVQDGDIKIVTVTAPDETIDVITKAQMSIEDNG
jgi:hypothetical protein